MRPHWHVRRIDCVRQHRSRLRLRTCHQSRQPPLLRSRRRHLQHASGLHCAFAEPSWLRLEHNKINMRNPELHAERRNLRLGRLSAWIIASWHVCVPTRLSDVRDNGERPVRIRLHKQQRRLLPRDVPKTICVAILLRAKRCRRSRARMGCGRCDVSMSNRTPSRVRSRRRVRRERRLWNKDGLFGSKQR
jgi:hypothetical protein